MLCALNYNIKGKNVDNYISGTLYKVRMMMS